ncbi:pre-rRNA processing protein [Bulinus truncatus]|nr:pre-rRNA processing protein [Bulinus truncatus]
MKTVKKKLPKSSSSNPATKKFREAVKRTFTTGGTFLHTTKKPLKSQIINSGGLTLEALEKHNASVNGFTEASLQDDATTVGGTTFNTWATNLTGCTNVTFNRVHHYINSNNAVHKEILAVLAAITEVIKESGSEGTDIQYFGALVTSLENADKTDTKMAMAHLLSIVIKRVPVAVLRSRFSQVEKTLLKTITDCVQNQSLSPLKSALLCLASLLRVQDISKWLDGSTTHSFNAILAFISHKKPKLRKTAHLAVKVILKGSLFMQQTPSPPCHPAAPITAQYCEKLLSSFKGHSNKVEVLHILSLLKGIIANFPASNIKALCETMLRFMTLTDLIMKTSCMEVLYHLFSAKPNAHSLPAEMNGQILTALYEYQPSEKDSQQMLAWIKVMEAATLNLAIQDFELSLNHLPRLFSKLMSSLLTNGHDIARSAVDAMKGPVLQKEQKFHQHSDAP